MVDDGRKPLSAAVCAASLALCLIVVGSGCGSDHDQNGTPPRPTASATRTATANPTATATPLPSIAGQEDLFGSTAQGSGALTIQPVPLVPAYISTCLGGSGTSCAGGSIVYIGSDPGFKEADTDDPSVPLFALPGGVAVGLEVIAIDPALSLMFADGSTLTAAGQSIELGTTPGIHADLEWQLLLAADAPFDAGHPVTLKLTTSSSGYTDSIEFTVTVRPSTGSPPSEPD